ncbi:MAG TPA: hypothetical protein VKE40_11000 [Gemmataceae bacterium]|nr:hypothetical protein [Gemmataceae bacterium]
MEAVEEPAAVAGQRLSSECGRLAPAVGLAEQFVADAVKNEEIGGREQAIRGGDSAKDQVGVFRFGRNQSAGGVDGGVNGLNCDLSRG